MKTESPRKEFARGGGEEYDCFHAVVCGALKEPFGELRANPAALILRRNGGGSKQRGVAMSFQADRTDESCRFISGDEKSAQMFGDAVVRQLHL